jgi:cytochrome c oxidase assembly protein subunit 15
LGRVLVAIAVVLTVLGTLVTGSGPNGGDPDAERLPFALDEITKLHAAAAWAMVLGSVILFIQLVRAQASEKVVKRGKLLLAALVVQGAIGYVQYWVNIPGWLAIFHVAGAVLTWLATIWWYMSLFERYEAAGLPVFDDDSDAPTGLNL